MRRRRCCQFMVDESLAGGRRSRRSTRLLMFAAMVRSNSDCSTETAVRNRRWRPHDRAFQARSRRRRRCRCATRELNTKSGRLPRRHDPAHVRSRGKLPARACSARSAASRAERPPIRCPGRVPWRGNGFRQRTAAAAPPPDGHSSVAMRSTGPAGGCIAATPDDAGRVVMSASATRLRGAERPSAAWSRRRNKHRDAPAVAPYSDAPPPGRAPRTGSRRGCTPSCSAKTRCVTVIVGVHQNAKNQPT